MAGSPASRLGTTATEPQSPTDSAKINRAQRSARRASDGDTLGVIDLQGEPLHQPIQERRLGVDPPPALRADLRQIVGPAQLCDPIHQAAMPFVVVLDRRVPY